MINVLTEQLKDFVRRFTQPKREGAEAIVRNQVWWSVGAALVPIPLVDVAAVSAVQVSLIRRLCSHYNVPFDTHTTNALVHALAATATAAAGASVVKAIPVAGTVVGGVALATLAGGATYAVGMVCLEHFEAGGTLATLDIETAKRLYRAEFERGKAYVERLIREQFPQFTRSKPAGATQPQPQAPPTETPPAYPKPGSDAVFREIQELNRRFAAGEVDEATYEATKAELLKRLDPNAP